MKCIVCEVEFVAVRSTAKYCSELCRQRGHRVSVTEGGVSVTENLPGDLSVTDEVGEPAGVVDLVKDLKLDLRKDLGVDSWTENGIFIRPDITIDQVQNIAKLVAAKNGCSEPVFRECR
jgi:hypothetical protein